MISEIFFVAGIFLILIIAGDFFYTTLSFNGAGKLAHRVSSFVASLFLWLNQKTGTRSLFKFSGAVHVLILVMMWISLLWIGFFLLLLGDPFSVVDTSTGTPVNAINKLYFSGYVLSTLGNGQYIPGSVFWQIVVAIFSFAGFIFITTAMTYLMNLTSAVIHKRKLSLFISNLGNTPEVIISNSYNGVNFERLTRLASDLQQMINEHSQNHYAHPGVHYFYSLKHSESLSVNLTNLDEALTLLQLHVNTDKSVDQDLRPLRNAISAFLSTVQHHFIKSPSYEDVNNADIQFLKEKGLSVKDQNIEIETCNSRRMLLSGLLQSSGWSWTDIYNFKKDNT